MTNTNMSIKLKSRHLTICPFQLGQLSKVMGVCEELQKERKSLAQQLLDLQDQLMSQEKKISEDHGHLQSSEAARKRAEEQLAKVSAEYQAATQECQKVKHSSAAIHQLHEDNEEMKTTVQNLVNKLEAVTQELIAVTEERDQLDDDMRKLKKEALQLGKASSSIQVSCSIDASTIMRSGNGKLQRAVSLCGSPWCKSFESAI